MGTPADITRAITLAVNGTVYARLVDKAREGGRTPGRYAQELFDAAWSARCAPTGDAALDAAVAAIGAGPASPAAGEAANEALKSELAELRRAARTQQGEIDRLYNASRAQAEAGAALEAEASVLRETIAALEARLADRDAEVAALKQAAEQLLAMAPPQPDPEPAASPRADTAPSASQLKTMRLYRSLGWTEAEIAVEMGVPRDIVREAVRSEP